MYEAQHPKEWEFIVQDCEAKLLIAANETVLGKAKGMLARARRSRTSSCSTGRPTATAASRAGRRCSAATGRPTPSSRPPSDVATLIYTSGTTGNPKGVILTHANLASNVSAIHEVFPMDRHDRSLSFLPWAHSFGQTCELHCLFSMGASIAICESVDKIIDNLAEVHPTLLFSVPRIFNKIYTAVQTQIAASPGPCRSS